MKSTHLLLILAELQRSAKEHMSLLRLTLLIYMPERSLALEEDQGGLHGETKQFPHLCAQHRGSPHAEREVVNKVNSSLASL